MRVAEGLALTLEATDSGRRLTVELSRKSLSIIDGDERLVAIELGLVQTDGRWASVTGIVRDSRRGAELPFMMIVDESTGEVALKVDGRPTRIFQQSRPQ